jgi:serine/threonine-protein phosphatase 2A regulatory subunit B'
MADLKSKSMKQSYLQEILDAVSQPRSFRLFTPETFAVFFAMIKANLIRAIPPVPEVAKVPMVGDDPTDTLYESAWPHLELVYEIFKRFLKSAVFAASLFVDEIDGSFLARFVQLFNSPDQRERAALKMVLHQLYLRFVVRRPAIRIAIQNVFLMYIDENRYFCGITELLDMMMLIVGGYVVPLTQEHVDFLVNILIPLHTSSFLHLFHTSLTCCVMQYIEKDPSLVVVIVRRLFRLWPVSCSLRELLFMGELRQIVEVMNMEQFASLSRQLFHKIGNCIASNNLQVSESAMVFWKNDKFLRFTTLHARDLFPIICPHLYRTGTTHWNTAIKNLAVSVIRICMETSPHVFDSFCRTMKVREQDEIDKKPAQRSAWNGILAAARDEEAGRMISEKAGSPDDFLTAHSNDESVLTR